MALMVTAKNEKQLTCPELETQSNKTWSIHTVECYMVLKMNLLGITCI